MSSKICSTGKPSCRAVSVMRWRKVLLPRRSFDLSRPMRMLNPPARIKTVNFGLRAAFFCRCTPAMNRVGPVRVHKKRRADQQPIRSRSLKKLYEIQISARRSHSVPVRGATVCMTGVNSLQMRLAEVSTPHRFKLSPLRINGLPCTGTPCLLART